MKCKVNLAEHIEWKIRVINSYFKFIQNKENFILLLWFYVWIKKFLQLYVFLFTNDIKDITQNSKVRREIKNIFCTFVAYPILMKWNDFYKLKKNSSFIKMISHLKIYQEIN